MNLDERARVAVWPHSDELPGQAADVLIANVASALREAIEECASVAEGESLWTVMELTAWMGLDEKKRKKFAVQIGNEIAAAIRRLAETEGKG
jgi:hypothetical protein